MMRTILIMLNLALLAGPLFSEMRVWRDLQGKQVEGEFVRIMFGDVMLEDRRGGKHYMPLESLSKSDAEYLGEIYVPELEIKVNKSSRNKFRSKNALADDQISIVRCDVTIQSKDKVENASLRAEAYLIGAEFATDDYKILRKVSSALKFTEENEYRSRFQLEAESRKYMEYNYQLRGTLYDGYLVLVLNKKDEIIQYKKSLSWLDEEEIADLRSFPIWDFFDASCKRRPVPRPIFADKRVGVQ